jgi:putative addiction module component (TIGR02574 family)
MKNMASIDGRDVAIRRLPREQHSARVRGGDELDAAIRQRQAIEAGVAREARRDSEMDPAPRAILNGIVHWTCVMRKPVPLPPPGFDDLSVEEKIDYLQSLWGRIAASADTIPVPDWHREILDERLKDLEANPQAGDSWEAVQERLRKKLDSRQ